MPNDLAQLLTQGGAVAALAFFVVAFIKGWIVPGGVYDGLVRDRDEWKNLALASTAGLDKAVRLAERRRVETRPAADVDH